MKILFVYTQEYVVTLAKPLVSPEQMNFGISYISSLLKQYGHDTRLAVLGSSRGRRSHELLCRLIDDFAPDIVAFTSVATQYVFVTSLAETVRERYPRLYRVIGGSHATLCLDDVITGPFDAVCISEGEYALLELVDALERGHSPHGIHNFWFNAESGPVRNPTRPFLENLDELPFPDRGMWAEWIDEGVGARFSILLGRGCPYRCTYCSNHALQGKSSGKYVRFRSAADIVAEITSLHRAYPVVTDYFLEVETFNVDREWTLDLCSALRQLNESLRSKLRFGTNIRITRGADFDELFAACSQANITRFTVGLESGSERVRTKILQRFYDNADVVAMARTARKYGCSFGFQNLVGLPTETEDDFLETVRLNRECAPDWYWLSLYYPYPGTELAGICAEMGLLRGDLPTVKERARPALQLSTFPPRRLRKRYDWFDYDIYRGKKPLLSLLLLVAVKKLFSIPSVYGWFYSLQRSVLFRTVEATLKR